MKYANVCGVKIAIGKKEELLSAAASFLGRGGVIFTPNLQLLELAQKNPDYKMLLNKSTLNIPDSVGVKYILGAGGIKTDTLAGVELGELLVEKNSFAIIGGKVGRAQRAGENFKRKYPDSRFLFSFSGYGYDEEHIKYQLCNRKPDVCIVCLGAPKQELFIERVRSSSPKTLFLALGGSVDIYSEHIKRAPIVFRRLGIEWLYRLLRQPKRIGRIGAQFAFFLREFFTVLNKKG